MASKNTEKKSSKSKKLVPKNATIEVRVTTPKVQIASAMESTASISGTTLHVLSHENGWAVKREGSTRATKVSEKKTAAVNHAISLLRKGSAQEVVIHDKDGKILRREKT